MRGGAGPPRAGRALSRGCCRAGALRLEETAAAGERRLQEKLHECAALGGELDAAREDAGRAVRRADQHAATLRE